MHPSPYFHIGGDETHLLGHCENDARKGRRKSGYRGYIFGPYKNALRYRRLPGQATRGLGRHSPEISGIHPPAAEGDYFCGLELRLGDGQVRGTRTTRKKRLRNLGSLPAIRSSPDNYFLTRWQ